jgi:hypothetical protein
MDLRSSFVLAPEFLPTAWWTDRKSGYPNMRRKRKWKNEKKLKPKQPSRE